MAGSNSVLMPVLAWAYLLNLWDLEMKLIIIAALLATSAPALAMDVYTCDAISAKVMQGEIIPGTQSVARQGAIVAATKNQFMSTINNASVKSPILNADGVASLGPNRYMMKDGDFLYGNDEFVFVLNNCVKVAK